MTKCITCGGAYAPLLPDSTRYFHACPPLSDTEVIAATGLNVDRTKWSAADLVTFVTASRVRPNARNENAPDAAAQLAIATAAAKPDDPQYWKKVNAALAASIVSAGAGVQ